MFKYHSRFIEEFFCPITKDLISDPVIFKGCVYSKSALIEWYSYQVEIRGVELNDIKEGKLPPPTFSSRTGVIHKALTLFSLTDKFGYFRAQRLVDPFVAIMMFTQAECFKRLMLEVDDSRLAVVYTFSLLAAFGCFFKLMDHVRDSYFADKPRVILKSVTDWLESELSGPAILEKNGLFCNIPYCLFDTASNRTSAGVTVNVSINR